MKMLKSNEGFISILLTIIITALLVGGGVYYYQKTVFDNSIKEAVKNVSDQTTLEIDQLKSQIEELEKEAVAEDVVDDTSSWQTYKNSWIANYSGPGVQLAFDFQFKYPTNLKVDGDNLYRFIRENNSEDGFLVRVSAQAKGAFEKYKKDQNKPNALLDDFIVSLAENSCAADGAGVSIYCKDAVIYEQGTSKNGIKHFVLSMKEITTYSDDRPDQERSRGPIYVLDVKEQTKGEYELLFFSPESKGLNYSGLADTLKAIVDSFSFPADISDWQTYNSSKYGLSFLYPSGWQASDNIEVMVYKNKMIGISSPEIQGDTTWGINVYEKSENNLEAMLADVGDQFSDRSEKKEKVFIDGIEATKITVTTASSPTWYAQYIVFEKNNKLFGITNGAIKDDKFQTFYESIKF